MSFRSEAELRIAVFFQHMPPHPSAAAARGRSIVESLSRLISRSKVTVYTSTPNPDPIEGVGIHVLNIPEIKNTQSILKRLIGELRLSIASLRSIFYPKNHADFLIISSPGYIPALAQAFFARRKGVPYILEMRDIYPQVYAEAQIFSYDSLSYKLLRKQSQRMYRGASLVVCATEGLLREVSVEEPRAHAKFVYNGFPGFLLQRGLKKNSRFTVCFHGVLGYFQDVETLLKVAEELQGFDVDVLVIGYGRKEKGLRKCTLSNLFFLGKQTFSETIDQIERCHMGLCLRLDDNISRDAFPVKVWEYLGLGIPVIITPSSEAGDFIRDNNCGIVLETGDVQGIVKEILKVKSNKPLYDKLSANCRGIAPNYTREKMGVAVSEAIIGVLPNTRKPTPNKI